MVTNIFNDLFQALFWIKKLGIKLLHEAPLITTVVVFIKLVSQVSLLLSFLLPLKIIMLLGTDGTPKFFPELLSHINKDTLILLLSVTTLLSYLVHYSCEKLGQLAYKKGSKTLLSKSKKIILFENQNEIATKAFRNYAQAFASITFAGLALTALGFFYIDVVLVICIYCICCVTTMPVLTHYIPSMRISLVNNTPRNINGLVNIGFLSTFSFIVIDFLYFSPPNFLVALATIILGRQLLAQLGITTKNFFNLHRQKRKLDALFFHDHAYIPTQHHDKTRVWQLLEKPYANKWIKDLISECLQQIPEKPVISWSWHQSGINNVLFLEVNIVDINRTFLIKVFDKPQTSLALHEASLLMERPFNLPAPELRLSTVIDGFHCHVFNFDGTQAQQTQNDEKSMRLKSALISVEPPKELVERYKRSKLLIWDRLEPKMLDRLKLIAEKKDQQAIEQCRKLFPDWKILLQKLPLTLVNRCSDEQIFLGADLSPKCTHWGNWKLEPLGASWSLETKDALSELEEQLEVASNSRESLKDIKPEHVALVCLTSDFERAYRQQAYHDALRILKRIQNTLEQIIREGD